MNEIRVPDVIPESCGECKYFQKTGLLDRYSGWCSFYRTKTYSNYHLCRDVSLSTSPIEAFVESIPLPKSVVFISWLLIIFSVVGLLITLAIGASISANYNVQLSPIVYVSVIIASIIQVIMGVGMLNGKNWARLLFLWLTPISIVVGLSSGRISPGTIFKVVWYIVFTVMLSMPHVRRYFHSSPASANGASKKIGDSV